MQQKMDIKNIVIWTWAHSIVFICLNEHWVVSEFYDSLQFNYFLAHLQCNHIWLEGQTRLIACWFDANRQLG